MLIKKTNEEVIFSYSRKQAIEDGVLVDLTSLARDAGIKFPVAVTRAVFELLNHISVQGQDFVGRAWDMLMIFRLEAKRSHEDMIHFSPLFLMKEGKNPEPLHLWAKCGPGDGMEPVITIMKEGED